MDKEMLEAPQLDSDKLKSMLQAHLDGIYVFSARENCDELVTALILAYQHRISIPAAVLEDIRVVREALNKSHQALWRLLMKVDTSTCGGDHLEYYHRGKEADEATKQALTRLEKYGDGVSNRMEDGK